MFVVFIVCLLNTCCVFGGSVSDIIGKDTLDAVDKVSEREAGISISGFAEGILSGEEVFSIENITESAVNLFLKEIKESTELIKPVFIAVILSAILKTLSSSFNTKSVSELSFYVCYMVMIFIVLKMFAITGEVAKDALESMGNMVMASMPVFYTLMALSGDYTAAYITGPFVAGAAGVMTVVGKSVVIPVVSLGLTLEIVNNISEREKIGKLASLVKKGIKYGLKTIAAGFMAVLSIQKLGTSVVDMAAGKTAKALLGAVPVVGDVFSGAVETAVALTGAVKSSYLMAVIVVIGVICIIPVLKILAVMVIFKIIAAITEPIGEKRFIKMLSEAGDYTGLVLSTLFTATVMFVFSAIIMMGII